VDFTSNQPEVSPVDLRSHLVKKQYRTICVDIQKIRSACVQILGNAMQHATLDGLVSIVNIFILATLSSSMLQLFTLDYNALRCLSAVFNGSLFTYLCCEYGMACLVPLALSLVHFLLSMQLMNKCYYHFDEHCHLILVIIDDAAKHWLDE